MPDEAADHPRQLQRGVAAGEGAGAARARGRRAGWSRRATAWPAHWASPAVRPSSDQRRPARRRAAASSAAATSASRATHHGDRGVDPLAAASRAPMPMVLPSPAAPITSAEQELARVLPAGIGCSRSRNAMNIVRNPDSSRGPQLARSAKATAAGHCRSAGVAPAVGAVAAAAADALLALRWSRPAAGSRIARIGGHRRRPRTRSAATTAARTSRPAPASGAETATPTTPASEIRALALTRVRPSRQQPGYGGGAGHAVRLGRDEHARAPPGTARPSRRPTASASTQHRKARSAMVAPIAQRRPWLNRSRNGPISGATIANGSIVRPRNSATWPRASPVGTWKNRVPASEIATAASPAALKACSSISRDSPDCAGALGVRRRGAPGGTA